jgi:thiamine-phosphate pyrophosphorylase
MPLAKLHLLTDTHLQHRYTHLELALMAAQAGADAVQYREKVLSPAQQTDEVRAIIAQLPAGSTTRIIVNDHVQVALEAQAHGVHVGLEDMPAHKALQLLPAGSIVGATVHNVQELEALADLPISYIGVGPVFGTTSKDTGLPPLGLAGLQQLCNLSPFPVIAIGSITAARVPQVMDVGAYGVAILSEFCLAPHPADAATALLRAMEPYR